MPNPFENEDGTYFVLINDEGQYSLWPTETAIPGGWRVALAAASKATCINFINQNWTDMRPKSLTEVVGREPGKNV